MGSSKIDEMLIGLSEVGDVMRCSPTCKMTVAEYSNTEYHGGAEAYNVHDLPTEVTVEVEVTPEGIAWREEQRKIERKVIKMTEKIIDGILNYLGDGVIQPHGYMAFEPIMTNFITSPPRSLTSIEFTNGVNVFFNDLDTLEEKQYVISPRYNNTISITTKKYDMADGGECYFIWAQGLLREYDRTRDNNEYFTMNLLFFVNRVKDENGIMRWRIVDRLAEKGLPSPSSAFKQARDNGDF